MAILVILGLIAMAFVLAIGVDFLFAYYTHRCPYCNHRMTHAYTKEDRGNIIHVFHCPNCNAWEEVSEEKLLEPFN